MANRPKQIAGHRYGLLRVLEPVGKNAKGLILWRCQCDCGQEVILPSGRLGPLGTKSCGCLRCRKRPLSRLHNLVGRRYGRLKVVSFERLNGRKVFWRCTCDCGGTTVVAASSLQSGNTRSCGCLMRETAAETGRSRRQHGLSGTSEYASWLGMMARCFKAKHKHYSYYGGRGITVCERWRAFEHFLSDMGKKPDASYTIDRVDPNGNYQPGNCRWAPKTELSRNTRR